MNQRKCELMEQYLNKECTVMNLINRIVELEESSNEMHKKAFLNEVKNAYEVQRYIIPTRLDAQKVLNTLEESAEKYSGVSVADYYDTIGIGPTFADNAYGWSFDNIKRASIIPLLSGGYYIKFPQVEVL